MAIFVRPFKKDDIKAFEPMEPCIGRDELLDLSELIEQSGLAVTGLREGKIIGCGGVHPATGGQGEIWLRLSRECLALG